MIQSNMAAILLDMSRARPFNHDRWLVVYCCMLAAFTGCVEPHKYTNDTTYNTNRECICKSVNQKTISMDEDKAIELATQEIEKQRTGYYELIAIKLYDHTEQMKIKRGYLNNHGIHSYPYSDNYSLSPDYWSIIFIIYDEQYIRGPAFAYINIFDDKNRNTVNIVPLK